MHTKTFKVVTSISMVFTLAIAVLSLVGIVITGVYPAIIVLLLLALIPVASLLYAKKITGRPVGFQRNYYTAFVILNLLLIPLVAWITFVILVDRVFSHLL